MYMVFLGLTRTANEGLWVETFIVINVDDYYMYMCICYES